MIARNTYSSLYYIYSAIRPGDEWPFGLSPGALASDDYNGHSFWDTETWMFPPLLMLRLGLAESCAYYRLNRLEAAEQNAQDTGYKGAPFLRPPPFRRPSFSSLFFRRPPFCESQTNCTGIYRSSISVGISRVRSRMLPSLRQRGTIRITHKRRYRLRPSTIMVYNQR